LDLIPCSEGGGEVKLRIIPWTEIFYQVRLTRFPGVQDRRCAISSSGSGPGFQAPEIRCRSPREKSQRFFLCKKRELTCVPVDAVAEALQEVLVVVIGILPQQLVDELLALEEGELRHVEYLGAAAESGLEDGGAEASGGREPLDCRPFHRFVVIFPVALRWGAV
jgi:hypothetical protein